MDRKMLYNPQYLLTAFTNIKILLTNFKWIFLHFDIRKLWRGFWGQHSFLPTAGSREKRKIWDFLISFAFMEHVPKNIFQKRGSREMRGLKPPKWESDRNIWIGRTHGLCLTEESCLYPPIKCERLTFCLHGLRPPPSDQLATSTC